MSQKLTILGNGALGCSFYYYLMNSSLKISIISKNMQCNILQVNDTNQAAKTIKFKLYDQKRIDDYLLVCVKAYDLEKSLYQYQKKIQKNCLILLCNNGFIDIDLITKILPQNPIVFMPCFFGAKLANNILSISNKPEVKLGSINQANSKQILALNKILNNNNIISTADTNIRQTINKKLIINATLNALGAIHQKTHNEILKNLTIKDQAQALCYESTDVLNQLEFICQPEEMWITIIKLLTKFGNNYNSMAQDIQNSKPTEINYINGYIIKIAKQFNLPANENKKIVAQLRGFYAN